MRVKELMQEFLEIDYATTVCRAAQKMEDRHTSSALVVKNGKPVGIFSERDIVKKVVAGCKDAGTTTVGEIMNTPIITIGENADVMEATDLMDRKIIRRLAVVDGSGKIVGKITARNIARNYRYLLGRDFASKQEQYIRTYE